MQYKEYVIEGDKTFGLYYIKPIGNGTVIKELRSGYSTIALALYAIDMYSGLVEKKRKRNGETNSSD